MIPIFNYSDLFTITIRDSDGIVQVIMTMKYGPAAGDFYNAEQTFARGSVGGWDEFPHKKKVDIIAYLGSVLLKKFLNNNLPNTTP